MNGVIRDSKNGKQYLKVDFYPFSTQYLSNNGKVRVERDLALQFESLTWIN